MHCAQRRNRQRLSARFSSAQDDYVGSRATALSQPLRSSALARGKVLRGLPALLVHAHGDNARHGDVRRGFRSDVNVTTADSPRSLSSPGPLEDTHTTMAAMTTTAHNYDDVKALLMPKNFDEGNTKVLPRRIISRRSTAPPAPLRHTGRAPALAMPLVEPH